MTTATFDRFLPAAAPVMRGVPRARSNATWPRIVFVLSALAAWFVLFELLLRIAIARQDSVWSDRLATQWARGIRRILHIGLGIRFQVAPELRNRARALRGAILVANHQSPLDIIAGLLLAPPRPLRFVARAGLGRGLPGVSAFLRQPGQVLLAKGDPDGNVRAMRSLGASLEQTGANVLLFPEGAKTPDTYASVRRFKPRGLAALRAGAPSAPLLVIAIHGAHAAWRGVGHRPGSDVTVRLELAAEIPPAVAGAMDDVELAAACEAPLRRALDHQGAHSWIS